MCWITDHICVGPAPMSSKDLETIKGNGVTAIVNLCAEFPQLHQLEKTYGFSVWYLPVTDDCAPQTTPADAALDWLEEEIHRGAKVLIHCRHGIGRTGTMVSAYLLRKGLTLKAARKVLKHSGAHPTHPEQWKFLKHYGKRVGGK
jgi:protein-tyrosine phosphatase